MNDALSAAEVRYLPHMAAVAFHALALLTFMDEQRVFDDRYTASNTQTPATTPETDSEPPEAPQKDAQGGLRVGARVPPSSGTAQPRH